MDGLEARCLFTAAPATTVVHVGPTQAIKSLDAVKWPANSSHAKLDIILDYSATPYSVAHHGFGGDVTIEPANPNMQPTLKLAPTNYPTLYSNYKLYIHNIKTVGGNKGILTGTNTGGSVDVEHVTMTDGGAIWRGQGCVNAIFKDNDDLGMAYDYVYSNFTGIAQNVLIDNSNTKVPVQEGPKEAAIRFMDTNNLTIKNVITKPWFNNGKVSKQDIQLRPASKVMNIIGCTFYVADVGDMTWRKPALPIQSVTFTNCTMTVIPHLTAGVISVKLVNCLVGGKRMTMTLR